MRSSFRGGRPALTAAAASVTAFVRDLLFTCVIFTLLADGNAQTDSSTQTSVNRGAARQMYGSGSLRQTGSASVLGVTTDLPSRADKDKEEPKNSISRNNDDHGKTLQEHGIPESTVDHPYESSSGLSYGGYGAANRQKPHSLSPDFYGPSRIPDDSEEDDDEDSDVPSYRNGAPVNGARPQFGIFGQRRFPGNGGFGRDGVYGSFDAAGLDEVDRSRVRTGMEHRHGFDHQGDPSERFTASEHKTLVQENDEEGSDSRYDANTRCGSTCTNDQFLCASTCVCIAYENRCDGNMDCENADDESNCESYEHHFNDTTCHGERSLPCPTSGKCIAKEWLCDGDNDCGDFSDESHCGPQKNCTADQFECRNGLCVPHNWVCDGENDCKDFSDEETCTRERICYDSDFICLDGTCILDFLRCNGQKDCPDGSDEMKCEIDDVECKENQFQCEYPRCISMLYRCDGDDDCGDGSDERNCPTTTNTSCSMNEFRCANGSCINKKWVCDKEIDCKYGEDEQNCQYPTSENCSSKEEFACVSGVCIPNSFTCDGVPDCSNGEDEHGCQIGCELTQYLCKVPAGFNETRVPVYPAYWLAHSRDNRRHCISLKHVCDGEPDCPEKDDEENCPKKVQCTDKDKCSHTCIITSNNQRACACHPGYVLGKDNATCEDVDECKFEKDPVCSQICENTRGSFVCKCEKGYVLRPDLRSCKALGANPTLLLANRIDIRQVSITGPKYTLVRKGLRNAIALDYHYKKNLIFWSDVSTDEIRKIDLNKSYSEDFIRWGLEVPGSIAIDWIHDLLFWTDFGTRRVEVITLDGSLRHVLVSTDIDKPRAIAVHPHYGYVYWTDWGSNSKIERADMDGTNRIPLITDNIYWPNGLTIDYITDRIYWADAKHRVIESAHIHGTDRKKIVTRGLHHPFAITVFEDTIYWTDWQFKSISLANKNNGRGFKTIHSGLQFPMDIHSYHPQRQPEYDNHCGKNNGRCSHMCLPNSMGYSCVCPVGWKINKDGKTCASNPDNLLIFSRRKDLRLISLDQSTKAYDVVIPVDSVESVFAISWNAKDDTIYWTDVAADTISKADLNGKNQKVIIHHNLQIPSGLAVDWISDKLYWIDAGTNRIECSNLDGSMRTLLFHENLAKPRDIVLNPMTGLMYWNDWGKYPKIEVAGMDGTERKDLITKNLMWPNGLAIDFEKKRLYWTDGGTQKIEYCDLDGKRRSVIISAPVADHPFSLAIHNNKIYWIDSNALNIQRADQNTGKNVTVIRSGTAILTDLRIFTRNYPTTPNRCQDNDCSHLCLLSPLPRKYRCVCPIGLVNNPDGKTCPETPTKYLLISHRYNIHTLSLDTNYTADTVISFGHMKNVSGADVDLETDYVYWTDPGQRFEKTIKRSPISLHRKAPTQNSTNKTEEIIIDGSIDTVDSLVVDSVGRKLYWTDVGLNSIEVSELDGSNRKVLVWSGLDNPRAIALHYPAGLLFWSDWGHNARIERADMDGEHRTAVVTEGLSWPNGLSIDLFADRIYWNDAKKHVIKSADLQGQDRRIIVDKVEHPYGLAVVGDFIYWSDWQEKALLRAKKSDGKNRKTILANVEGIMDVRLVDKQQVRPENACEKNNGGCSHLCLRNPSGFSCACPTGIIISDDKKTCNNTPTNFLLLATRKTLVRISLDTPEMWEVSMPIQNVLNAFSVDFHWEKQYIFYIDSDIKIIRRINMRNFNDTKVIINGMNVSTPYRLAVDWIADNIYWTDMKHRTIEVARLDGSNRKRLIENLKQPRYLALFPKEGYIFWTEWGNYSRIERANLDGSNRKSIITTDVSLPNGLSIDYAARKLYWADALKDRIEVSDLHGRYRVALVPKAYHAYGLSQYGNNIYWSDWFKDMIERADKRTGKNHNKIRNLLDGTTDIRAVSPVRQTGWNPCAMENGGCSHLCFFTKKNYTCGCPDKHDSTPCSTVPSKWMPLRKPGTENDPSYDDIDDEDIPPTIRTTLVGSGGSRNDRKLNDYNRASNEKMSLRTMITTTVILFVITVVIIIVIIYLQCPRKNKREEYLYNNRRNVLTFSNPNYNASAGAELTTPTNQQSQDKKSFIWKRLKYDKSQERVYEDNGQTSSPEVVSLIAPSATPSSSRAASVTPLESSPPAAARISVQRLEPSIVAGPKSRPIV